MPPEASAFWGSQSLLRWGSACAAGAQHQQQHSEACFHACPGWWILASKHFLCSCKRLQPKQIDIFKVQKGKVCDFFFILFFFLDLTEDRSVLLWSFLLHLRFMSQSFVLINQSSLQTLFLYNIHFITFYGIKLISIVASVLLVLISQCTASKL